MSAIIKILNKFVDSVLPVFAQIGGFVCAAMMFLTFFDVALRYIFNKPISGSLEITEFMMAVLITFALGYTALKKGHIRVDLIMTYASKNVNRIMDIFCYGVATIFYILICWQVTLNAFALMASKLTSSVLFIPVYPFVFLLVVGCIMLVLVFLRDTLVSIRGEEQR